LDAGGNNAQALDAFSILFGSRATIRAHNCTPIDNWEREVGGHAPVGMAYRIHKAAVDKAALPPVRRMFDLPSHGSAALQLGRGYGI
jgi:hypothetical protein